MPTKIEWCDETLNPFWGCTHNCWYCQARRIAHMRAERIGKLRGYPSDVIEKMKHFEPVWLPDAERILSKIGKWRKPRNIFVGFMGDIACQDQEHINHIISLVANHNEHRFLILTKNTSKIQPTIHDYMFKDSYTNVWFGYSDDNTQDKKLWAYYAGLKNVFVSLEPLIGSRLNINHYIVKWIIVGALTDRRGQPVSEKDGGTPFDSVIEVLNFANAYKIPIFLKDNLLRLYPKLPLIQEFPWKK